MNHLIKLLALLTLLSSLIACNRRDDENVSRAPMPVPQSSTSGDSSGQQNQGMQGSGTYSGSTDDRSSSSMPVASAPTN